MNFNASGITFKDVTMSHEPYELNTKYRGCNDKPLFNLGGSFSLELNSEISQENINKLLGIDSSRYPDSCDISYIKYVQARRHKKKRINKKWLKRYGVKPVTITNKGFKLHTYTDGTFEFVK